MPDTACTNRLWHQHAWRVTVYRANYSAFNGYRRTRSDYSEVVCTIDGRRWRTKAAYVEELPAEEQMVDRA